MPINKIVVNSSPLILLFKSGLENILPQLFSEVVVPQAVWNEISIGNDIASEKLLVNELGLVKKGHIEIPNQILIWNLGDGESEVLSHASFTNEYNAVVDDRAARNCAKALGIRTLGTGAILILAKKHGFITSVRDSLSRLQEAGLYISVEVTALLIDQAGE